MANVKETSVPMPVLLTMSFRKKDWKKISAESSRRSSPPKTQSVEELNELNPLLLYLSQHIPYFICNTFSNRLP